jgi:hypothetical protein
MESGYYEVHCGPAVFGPFSPTSTFPTLTREECKEDAIAMAEYLVAENAEKGILKTVEVLFYTGGAVVNLCTGVWSSDSGEVTVCEPHHRSRLSPLAERASI